MELARTVYTAYTQYFWQGIIKYTVIYGVYVRFWPTLSIYDEPRDRSQEQNHHFYFN
jgi:hypothetical protein